MLGLNRDELVVTTLLPRRGLCHSPVVQRGTPTVTAFAGVSPPRQRARRSALPRSRRLGAAPTGVEPAGAPARGEWEEAESTSHLSVADAEGMAVALTQSLGPGLGTRVITPGLGFLYATRLGAEPGSRPISGISPTIVLNEDGALAYVTGAAGGARIVASIVQILSRLVDHRFPLDDAVAAPRIHPTSWTRGPGVATPRVHPSTKLELSVEMGRRTSGRRGRAPRSSGPKAWRSDWRNWASKWTGPVPGASRRPTPSRTIRRRACTWAWPTPAGGEGQRPLSANLNVATPPRSAIASAAPPCQDLS